MTTARKPSAEIRDKVMRALASVGLDGLDARRPSDLSGGQQSRVALARALLRARPLLLLDEPFSALGPGLRREMLSLVQRIAKDQGASLVYVTHQPDDCQSADFTAFVGENRIHDPRPTEALFRDPPKGLQDYL